MEDSNKYLIAFCSNGLESDKPYMWDGKAYQRHDSVTTVMPRERFLRLHEEQTGLTYKWERKVNPNLTIDSLDDGLIHRDRLRSEERRVGKEWHTSRQIKR